MNTAPVPTWATAVEPRLPGRYIHRLMGRHQVTIKDLAHRMRITQKRVREVRANGIRGKCMCLDWYEAITKTGIFLTKGSPMPSTTTPAVDIFTGHITLQGIRVQVDFETPANATRTETDAAFLAALSKVATIDYLVIGTTP